MNIKGLEIDDTELTDFEAGEIRRLLSTAFQSPPDLEDIWRMMDLVWAEMECDNRQINRDKISRFYSHPIWLMNGFFIEQHSLSMQQRSAIAHWVKQSLEIQSVLEYGGGFGTLARLISETRENLTVDIYEPYPHNLSILKIQKYSNIHFIQNIERQYDCLISTDVLEHVTDPLHLFSQMIGHVKLQGYLIIANCFYPVIECHLPETFHFRHSFDHFAKMMGLEVIGICQGSHGTIYQKVLDQPPAWSTIRKIEKLSKISFPLTELILKIRGKLKKVLIESLAS